jgi:hypothetical protein
LEKRPPLCAKKTLETAVVVFREGRHDEQRKKPPKAFGFDDGDL